MRGLECGETTTSWIFIVDCWGTTDEINLARANGRYATPSKPRARK